MKIGIVGYQGAGKSTLFEWLTGVASDPSRAHQGQSAMAPVPDRRIEQLCSIYEPKKVTRASMELVDTPGLSRDQEGNPARLATLREAGCLILVVAAFGRTDPGAELPAFAEDLLLADLEIVTTRIERLRESVKKPRPSRDQELAELEALEPLAAHLESGSPISELGLTDEQSKAVRSFGLLTQKPRLVVFNVADDEENPDQLIDRIEGVDRETALAIPVGLQCELDRMSDEERDEMIHEMGLQQYDRDSLLLKILDTSGQMVFFTAGEKEVRTWMIRKGGSALEAADGIHSDMARGFIRAEVMPCDELVRCGSERELKAQNLVRQEPKDYIIQDGDILLMKFNV